MAKDAQSPGHVVFVPAITGVHQAWSAMQHMLTYRRNARSVLDPLPSSAGKPTAPPDKSAPTSA
jgi:hypothetical protein